jgi:DMSO reductase family type II enzyme chaperone
VTADVLGVLDHPEALRAGARSRVFGLLAGALAYPESSMLDDIREGRLADALARTLGDLDSPLTEGLDCDALRDGLEADELAIEYTRLFDVGTSGPPCPLHGGLWSKERMKNMEEVLRFYNHFDLTLDQGQHELPDHLTAELEFLHFLAFREAEALQAGVDAGAYRRAQRDFIERHPGRWVPKLRRKLEASEPPRFFAELFSTLEQILADEYARLSEATEGGHT